MRTVLETEYSIDDIFDAILHFFLASDLGKRLKKDAKAEKAKEAIGFVLHPFLVTDQNTGTCLNYREIPLPW